jgi:DNA-directed RNA polymerase specialized sigma24 family protein
MSTSGDKRSRAVCIKAYLLSMDGHTHRQIADIIGCKVEQIPGKIKRGRLACIRDERSTAQRGSNDA